MEILPPNIDKLTDCQSIALGSLAKGTVLYHQGSVANEFYLVRKGLVGLYHTLENGKESLMRLYQKGDFFGYRTLFSNTKYHCTARVLIEADIIQLKPLNAVDFLKQNPELSVYLISQLANELQESENRLTKNAYNKSAERIIETTRFLTEKYPDYAWTYREIAEYAGCETETAIRISKKLEREGILKSHEKR